MPDESTVFAEHSWETRAGGKMLLYLGPHLEDNFDASPAIVGSDLYLRGKAYLYCLSEQ